MCPRPRLFLDFDGTIVDNRQRMYAFCCDWWPGGGFARMLDLDEYWSLKRMRVDEVGWIEKNFGVVIDSATWLDEKLAHMEDDCYLSMDMLIPGALDALKQMRSRYEVVLVSRRERHRALVGELERLGVFPFLDDTVLLTHTDGSKAAAIKTRYDVGSDDVLVGDTEDDLQSGFTLGVRTFLVLSGVRDRWVAESVAPVGAIQVGEDLASVANTLFS